MNIKMSPNKIVPTKPKPSPTNKISSTTDEKSSAIVVGGGAGAINGNFVCNSGGSKKKLLKIIKINKIDSIKIKKIPQLDKLKLSGIQDQIKAAVSKQIANNELNSTNTINLNKSKATKIKGETRSMPILAATHIVKTESVDRKQNVPSRAILIKSPPPPSNTNKLKTVNDSCRTKNILINYLEQKKKKCVYIEDDFEKDGHPNKHSIGDKKIKSEFKKGLEYDKIEEKLITQFDSENKSSHYQNKSNKPKPKFEPNISRMCASKEVIITKSNKNIVNKPSDKISIQEKKIKPVEAKESVISGNAVKVDNRKPIEYPTAVTHIKRKSPKPVIEAVRRLDFDTTESKLQEVEGQHSKNKETSSNEFYHVLRQVEKSTASHNKVSSNNEVAKSLLKWLEPSRNFYKSNDINKTPNNTLNQSVKNKLNRSNQQQMQCDFENKKVVVAEQNLSPSKLYSNYINSPIKLAQISLQGNSLLPDNKIITRGSLTSRPTSKQISIDKKIVVVKNTHKKCTYGEFEKKNDQKIVITKIFQENPSKQLPPFEQTFLNSNEIIQDLIQTTKQQHGDVSKEPSGYLESQLRHKNFDLSPNLPKRNVTFKIKGHDPVTGNYQLEIYDSIINPPKLFTTEENVALMPNSLFQKQYAQTNNVQFPSNLKKNNAFENNQLSSVIVKQIPSPLISTPAENKVIGTTTQSSGTSKLFQKDLLVLGTKIQSKKPISNTYDYCYNEQKEYFTSSIVKPSTDISVKDNFNMLGNDLISTCNYIPEGREISSLTNTGNTKRVNNKMPINQILKSGKHFLNKIITFPNNEEMKNTIPEATTLSQNKIDTKIGSVKKSSQPTSIPVMQNWNKLTNACDENDFFAEHQKLKIEKIENTDSSFSNLKNSSEPENAVDFLLSFGDSNNKTIDLSTEYSSSVDSDLDDSEFEELFSRLPKINVPKIEQKDNYIKLDELFSEFSEINQEYEDIVPKIESKGKTEFSPSKPIVIENKILSEHERINFSYLNTIPQFETPTRSKKMHSIGETISLKPCDFIIKNEKTDVIELAPFVIVPPPDECEENNTKYFIKELSETETSKDSIQTSNQNFTNPMNIEEEEPNYQQTFEGNITSSQLIFNTAHENTGSENREFSENKSSFYKQHQINQEKQHLSGNVVEDDNQFTIMSPTISSNFVTNSKNNNVRAKTRHSTKSGSSNINFPQREQKNLLNVELSTFLQNQPFEKETKISVISDDRNENQNNNNIKVIDKRPHNSNKDYNKNLVTSNEKISTKVQKTQSTDKSITVSKLKKKDIKIPVKLKKSILRRLDVNKNLGFENNKSNQKVLDSSKDDNSDNNIANIIEISPESVSQSNLIKIEENESPTKNSTFLQLKSQEYENRKIEENHSSCSVVQFPEELDNSSTSNEIVESCLNFDVNDQSMSFCDNMETSLENKNIEENVFFEIHEIIENLSQEKELEKTEKDPVHENLENSNNDYFMDIDNSVKSPTIIKSQILQNQNQPSIVSNTDEELMNIVKRESQGYESSKIEENYTRCTVVQFPEELENSSINNEIVESSLNIVNNENTALHVDQPNVVVSSNDERQTSSSSKSIKNSDEEVLSKRRRISSSSEEENLLSLKRKFLKQINSQLTSLSTGDIENIPLKKRRTQKFNAKDITEKIDEPVVRKIEESKPIKSQIVNKLSPVMAPDNKRTKSKKGSKKLHPQLLLIQNRQDIDKVDLITFNKNKTPKSSEIRCGMCKMIVLKKLWNQHLGTHYGVGWKEGEEPMDLTLHCVVLNKINDYLKTSKCELIKCRLCGMGYKSGLGILTHLDTCGLSKEEKCTDCEYCNRSFSKLSISSHYKVCTEKKKKLLDESKDEFEIQPDVEVLSNTGRFKRKSTLKAENKLKKIDADNKFDPNEHIKMVTGLTGGVLKKIQKEIKSKGSAKCDGCEKLFTDYDSIFSHGKICTEIIRSGYNCKLCNFHAEEITIVQQHIMDEHNDLALNEKKDFSDSDNDVVLDSASESDDDCSSGFNENEILSDDEEISDSDLISERSQKSRKTSRFIKQKDYSEDSKFTKLVECEKSPFFDLLKNVVSWTKKFEEIHYSKTVLFRDLLPDQVLPSNLIFEDYYPKNCFSMKFSYSKEKFNSNLGSSKPSSKWKELERFHSAKINNEIVIFVGGPITTLNWVPIQENSSSQYLSITYKLDFNEYIKKINPKLCKSLILIYEINLNKSESKNSLSCGNIKYGVVNDSSPINDVVFLPSGGYQENINRLGLMAIADMRNVVNIYSLPIKAPKNCDNSFNLFNIIELNTKIELKLTLCDKSENMKIFKNYTNVFCTKIAWSKAQQHNLIATGYSNGFVAIWNISKENNLNVFEEDGAYICTPVNYFMVSDKAVTGIEFHYDTSTRWLMVTSLSRAMKIYNIENLIVPVCIMDDAVKSFPLSFEWPVIWENPCISYTSDMAFSAISTYSPLGIHYKYRRYSRHPDSVRAINFNCWTNLMAVGCDNGDFSIEINGEMNQDVTLPRYFDKKFFSFTDLVSLNNEKLFSLPNVGQKMSKEEDSKMKAALQSGLKLYDIDYHNKYGVVFGPLHYDNFDKKYRVHEKRLASFNLSCFIRINCVSWNQNEFFSNLGAIGYENGFIRIINFDVNKFKTEGKII